MRVGEGGEVRGRSEAEAGPHFRCIFSFSPRVGWEEVHRHGIHDLVCLVPKVSICLSSWFWVWDGLVLVFRVLVVFMLLGWSW